MSGTGKWTNCIQIGKLQEKEEYWTPNSGHKSSFDSSKCRYTMVDNRKKQ